MKVCKTVLALAITGLSVGVLADAINITSGADVSSTDLFQGASVTDQSNILSVSNAGDLFGAEVGPTEPGNVISEFDNAESWITFATGDSISANRFTISLIEDTSGLSEGDRSCSIVSLWTSSGGAEPVWVKVFDQSLDNDYLTTYGSHEIKVVATFDTPVSSKLWKVQWDSHDGDNGARVQEVDAVIPEPAVFTLIALFGGGLIVSRRCGLFG